MDLGCARARYFLSVGPKLPEVLLVGVEIARIRVERALELLEKAGLGDRARLICGNALTVIRDHVPLASLSAVSIMFPDPWPKKGHAERRIFEHASTVALLARRLKTGGLVLLKHDAEPYFQAQRAAFGASPAFEETSDLTVRAEGEPPFSLDWPDETRYEQEWKKEGRAIHLTAFRRTAAPPPPPEAEVGIADRGSWKAAPTPEGEALRKARHERPREPKPNT